jgi:L-Ala-D/L-Glu epimerase
MKIHLQTFTVQKRVALTISRGTTAQSQNLFVRVEHDGIEGWGEASPFSIGTQTQTTPEIARALQTIAPLLAPHHPTERQKIETILGQMSLPSAARSALDLALYDWLGKALNLPLYAMWGLDCDRIVPTAVTIGISDPEAAQSRTRDWLKHIPELQVLKVKLGSPAGLKADKAMFSAVKEAAPHIQFISIDANGGWDVTQALEMADWLAEEGVTYLEQPIAAGHEKDFLPLYDRSPLPIFADESCWTSRDIPALSDRVHGINIKLNKSGGLSEALKMIHTARAHGLKVMFGCYSDSTLMNTALSHLAPLADHLDLDSHLNLKNDPFEGATLSHGRLIPSDRPGLGVVRELGIRAIEHNPQGSAPDH